MKCLSWAAILSLVSLPVLASNADEMKSLLAEKRPVEAYQLGKQHSEALGEPAFDFFFGIAAIDSNAPGEGVLALERYLGIFPNNRSARFHLARGYYILGEDTLARQAFADLLDDAGADEIDAINKFLDAIRARESRYTPTATFFAEAGIGYDSNINGGIRAGQVAGLPNFVIGTGKVQEKEADTFRTANFGVNTSLPVAPGVALYAGAQVGGRWHFDKANDIFDQRSVSLQGGASYLNGRNLFRLGGEYAAMDVDQQSYLNVSTLLGEWNHQFDQFNRLSLGLQWSSLRYDNFTVYDDKKKTTPIATELSVRDSDLYMANATWVRAFALPYNPVFNLSMNLGQERNRKEHHDLSRDLFGARAALTLQPLPKWSTGVALSYQSSRYDDLYPGSDRKRRDHYYGLDASVGYAINREWSVRTEYTYSNQTSNIGFYDFARHVLAAKVRYDFK